MNYKEILILKIMILKLQDLIFKSFNYISIKLKINNMSRKLEKLNKNLINIKCKINKKFIKSTVLKIKIPL